MRLAFIYRSGRLARLAEVAGGELPSEFFYGAVELAAAGHEVEHFEIANTSPAPRLAAALDLLRRAYLTPPKTFGHALVNAWKLSPRLADFDCVVATLGHYAFPLAACHALGRLRPPVVAIQCGLLHHPYPPPRRAVTRALLDRMESVFFGEAELAPVIASLGADPARLSVNQFGVDLDFWTPAGERENYVFAIGNDARRDFATLLTPAKEIDAQIRIVTRLKLPDPLPPNVTVIRGSWQDRALPDAEIRELYRRAACVVTPLHDSLQPSGQSVTLQAMACGTPVVLTRTAGLWNPAALADGENIRLVPPAQPPALAEAVRSLFSDRDAARRLGDAGRRYVKEHGDIASFARGIEAACQRAIAAG